MKYFDRCLEFRQELWSEFEKLVREGARFPELLDVTYPEGQNPVDLSKDEDGLSYFLAKELVADEDYSIGELNNLSIVVHTVTFIDIDDKPRTLEPDILDMFWLAELLDEATMAKELKVKNEKE